jgi:hypothetical protein
MIVSTILCLAVALFGGLAVRVQRDREGSAHLELTASLILLLSFSAYIAALPLSRLFFDRPESEIDADFMSVHLQALAGLLAGFVFAMRMGLYRRAGECAPDDQSWGDRWQLKAIVPLVILLHAGYYGAVLQEVGYDPLRLLDRYGTGNRSYEEATLVTTAVSVGATAVSWLAAQVALRQRISRLESGFVWGTTTLLATLYLVRGNRNSLIILALPILACVMHRRRLSVARLAVGVAFCWVGLYTVGIVRNWGFGRLDEVNVSVEAYDPVRGEMGTMYSVYEKYMLRGMMESTPLYGSSYVVSPLVNLVPREWWRERPHTIAQEASVIYYGTGSLTEGIGYSPVIEVIRNFGRIAVLPVFAVMAAIVALYERLTDRRSGARSMLYATALPMIVNYCRIDFATVFKMALLYMVSLVACHLLSRERRAGADGLEQGRPEDDRGQESWEGYALP